MERVLETLGSDEVAKEEVKRRQGAHLGGGGTAVAADTGREQLEQKGNGSHSHGRREQDLTASGCLLGVLKA